MRDYQISLQARNEGLIYQDASGIYRFNLSRQDRTWVVHLPPTKGSTFALHSLSQQEQDLLYPRIRQFLSRIWWFGIWPVNYEVKFGG
jgi:hypothetical protein